MKRRVFIAIDLPRELKEKVSDAVKQWRWLPIRWLAPENWHITLIPPVYLEDAEVRLLCDLLEKKRLSGPFLVEFSRIVLAPPGGKSRMIWLEGETPPKLLKLKKKLEGFWLTDEALPEIEIESRPLKLHVTLARFEPGDLKEIEEKTRVLGEVKFSFNAVEVAVMKSRLLPSGAEYDVVGHIALK